MSSISTDNSSIIDDTEPFLNHDAEKLDHRHRRRRRCPNSRNPALPWIFTTAILSMISIILALRQTWSSQSLLFGSKESASKYSYENGFETDLDVVRPVISTHRVRYTGGLLKHKNGTLYREHRPGDPIYFGEPTPEIDAAWADLLYSSGLDLEGDEANSVKNRTFEEPLGGMWRTGLDVFHALHCVNLLRKAFDADHYPDDFDDPPRLVRLHREHCLDYLRQQVMCHADLSPVILKWDPQVKYLIPQFWSQMHTCRNFEQIHEWSRARAAERYFDMNDRLIVEAVKAGDM